MNPGLLAIGGLLASVFSADTNSATNGMLYDLPLKPTGMVLGGLLIAGHVLAMMSRPRLVPALRKFPRSEVAGSVLLTIAALWAFALVARMDLGEFQPQRRLLMVAVPVMYFAALFFMTEFLAVRATGMLALLAGDLLLDAAFMRDPLSRLLLPALAYVWIVLGLFWVGMPYTMRDQIAWLTAKPARFQMACVAGVIYGLAVLGCAIAFY
jgi:hypothetical protein